MTDTTQNTTEATAPTDGVATEAATTDQAITVADGAQAGSSSLLSDLPSGESGATEGEGAAAETEVTSDADAGAADDAGTAAEAVPYEGLKAPEGFGSLDEAALTEATPILRSLGLETTEQAQGVIDQFAPVVQNMVERAVAEFSGKIDANHAEIRKGWATETQSLEGFDKMKTDAALALDKLGSTELREALATSGFGDHPELFKFAAAAGRALAEDPIHLGHAGQPAAKSPAQLLYGEEFQGKQ